ncbi:nuclear transcription factor Y subunit A-10-like [Impatiens glandulifera]|uniref:nuclear transcription factor Y subunit A-10-like n=1 Tax=Impatiens glandulifera TaxID=253017 RepID=UPI001FB0EA73|nr:nuclear transcription factor Y subunit A-10-like [Impatiens glandulifera]XP_047332610.1 nuclear transcription factor Y subunit A-10-like [Impatiens glandulifera]XP_047332611.1 nuclear transcription factor Y subunit A-10-like [Impatiens glandulifera]
MTMTTLCFKEHERGVVKGQIPSATMPWWSGLGSHSSYGQSCGAVGGQVSSGKQKQVVFDEEPLLEEGGFAKFTISPGNGKKYGNDVKNPNADANLSMQTADPSDQGGYFSLGFAQPTICGKISYGDPNYNGLFSAYGPQLPGRIMLHTNSDEGPIYVNAKQYHGILRRRLSRAKAISQKKAPKVRKPYMHLSRHLHAVRRPRGCGGRFLNRKIDTGNDLAIKVQKRNKMVISDMTDSQSSEVLQSCDGGNLMMMNSPRKDLYKGYSNNISYFEVTSHDSHQPFMLGPHVHDFSGMLSARHGRSVMPSKCNLNV